MKKLILALLLIPTFAYADIAILLRNGAVHHLKEEEAYYVEEESNLCKPLYGGRVCYSLDDITRIWIGRPEELPPTDVGKLETFNTPLSDEKIDSYRNYVRIEVEKQRAAKEKEENKEKDSKQKVGEMRARLAKSIDKLRESERRYKNSLDLFLFRLRGR